MASGDLDGKRNAKESGGMYMYSWFIFLYNRKLETF